MAGIYIHIPFCRRPCNYCDFYFCVSLSRKSELLDAIKAELINRQGYLNDEPVETIYFGGGTPTVLMVDELNSILGQIKDSFQVNEDAEITTEANPDDLTPEYINALSKTSFNRLSIGVQSFNDQDLIWMNRRHDSLQAGTCIKNSIAAGFSNISIDLIYGTPCMNNDEWVKNIDTAISLNIPHISAYHLTYEPGTIVMHKLNKKRITQIDEIISEAQYNILLEQLQEAGYVAYEISNFAKPGMESKHNSNYWKQKNYLGIGPSAHSFNGHSRRWNIKNIKKYTRGLLNNPGYDDGSVYETEELTDIMKYNEYILTGLRTIWGVSIEYIIRNFSEQIVQYFNNAINKLAPRKMIEHADGVITIPAHKKLVSDKIILEFIFEE